MNPKETTLLFEIADKMDAFENTVARLEADLKNDKQEIKALKKLVAVLQLKLEAYRWEGK